MASPTTIGEGTWRSPGYRSARTRATAAQIMLGLSGVLAILAALTLLSGLSILNDFDSGRPADLRLDAWVSSSFGVSAWQALVSLGTALAFLAWLSRSVDNVPPLQGGTPKWSPRWSIGWWFVPIAWFVMPFLVVRDLARHMGGPGTSIETVVTAWWVLFVGSLIGSRVPDLMALPDTDAARSWILVSTVAQLGYLAAAALAILVVRRLQVAADDRARVLSMVPDEGSWPQVSDTEQEAAREPASVSASAGISEGVSQAAPSSDGAAGQPGTRTVVLSDEEYEKLKAMLDREPQERPAAEPAAVGAEGAVARARSSRTTSRSISLMPSASPTEPSSPSETPQGESAPSSSSMPTIGLHEGWSKAKQMPPFDRR